MYVCTYIYIYILMTAEYRYTLYIISTFIFYRTYLSVQLYFDAHFDTIFAVYILLCTSTYICMHCSATYICYIYVYHIFSGMTIQTMLPKWGHWFWITAITIGVLSGNQKHIFTERKSMICLGRVFNSKSYICQHLPREY